MKKLIYICGSHSSGKTTLLTDLKEHFESQGYKTTRNRTPREVVPADKVYTNVDDLHQFYITFGIASEILSAESDIILTDRFIIDNLAYSSLSPYIGEALMNIQLKFVKIFYSTFNIATFYLPIEFKMEEDGVRPSDEQYRARVDHRIRFFLDVNKVFYSTLTGTPGERLRDAVDILTAKGFKRI